MSYLISFLLIYMAVVSGLQGKHAELGKRYYEQGDYSAALAEFRKETETWYLRLDYNYHEISSMERIAKTYCQMEDFEKARATYETIIKRYSGYYHDRAEKDLMELENGLMSIASCKQEAAQQKDATARSFILYDIARIYYYHLRCHRKALEVYRQITDMDIPELCKELARKQIQELSPP